MDIKNLKLNIEQKVLGKKRVVIVPHKRIDFDAIGSALGLAVIVRKMNAVPIIVVDDNIKEMQRGIQIIMDDVSKDFEIVSRDKYLEMKDDDDVYILTDVNKRGMVSIEDTIHDPERTIIIDHHNMDDTTIESDATYVDEYVSSASEIVARLMCMFKCKSTPEIANYLLAGIYLDTNHMSKNVSNDTFLAASKLANYGANINRVNDLFLEDFTSDRRVQDLVNKVEMVSYTIATILADEGIIYTPEELAKATDYVLKYGVDASFAIGNIGDGVIQVSARSPENINVGEVMKELGGGGNQASGAARITDSTVEEVGKTLRKVLEPKGYNRPI